MKAANRVAKNTMVLYAKMFITVIPSLYTTRIVLEALGVKDFGILSLVLGILSMLNFFNAALSTSTLRFMSFAKGKNDFNEEVSVFNISLSLHLALGILLSISFIILIPFFIDNVLTIDADRVSAAKTIFNYLVIGMFITVVSVPYDALINAHEDMYIFAYAGIIEAFLKLFAAMFIASYMGDRLEVYGLLSAIITGLIFIIKFIVSHKKYSEAVLGILKYYDKKLLNSMLSFSSYNLLAISFQMIAFYGQGVLLNMFFGTTVNAAQAIVNQMSGQLTAFANTMQKALNPMIIKSEGAGNRERMLEASFAGNKISFFMLMFFYIPVLLEMKTILDFWLVSIPEFTIIFATLYFIRNLIDQTYQTLGPAIFSVGNIKRFQIFNSFLSLLPLPVAYLLFKNGSPASSIYVIFIVYSFVQGAIYVYFAKKECSMSIRLYFKKVIVKSVIPFLITYAVVFVPHSFIKDDLERLIVVVIVNTVVFVLSVWFVGLHNEEKKFVMVAIDKLKQKFFLKYNKKGIK